jgi:hypothetical protein
MATDTTLRRPWWRRLDFRLSVRALIVLVLVIGGGLGWIVHRARTQRLAVAAIERAGGRVGYYWKWYDPTTNPPTSLAKPWPKWLVDAVGIDYLADVVGVQLSGYDQRVRATDDLMTEVGKLDRLRELDLNGCERVTDAGLAHLRGLSRLRKLKLMDSGIKGPGLVNLEGMAELRELELHNIPVTDADMAHLSGLIHLEKLGLSGPGITDAALAHLGRLDLHDLRLSACPVTTAGLTHLRGMARLEVLTLNETRVDSLEPLRNLTGLTHLIFWKIPITDEGLAPVANFPRLANLWLRDTPIGDTGLVHLRGHPGLELLNLEGTRITDAGLAHIAGLSRIQHLLLIRTAISDAGLAHLTGLTKCQQVNVKGTAVTAQGAAAMTKTVPQMRVDR